MEFKPGDRVKVEYEATVETGGWRYLTVRTDDMEMYSPHAKHVALVEPAYVTGELYRDAKGRDFRRNKGDWFAIEGHGHYCGDDIPVRPLTRLVPEQ